METSEAVEASKGQLSVNTANNNGQSPVAAISPPERSGSAASQHKPSSHIAAHRQSFAENQRHPPPSPRAQRHPSFTQAAIQELLNHPPSNRHPDPRYAGREWTDIALGELASPDDVRWADLDTSIQDATMTLVRNNPSNVVLIRESPSSKAALSTFDSNDLNTYLLVVVGLAKPDDEDVALYSEVAAKAQAQTDISLREVHPLFRKEELVILPAESTLDRAMEAFGSGIHRILAANEAGEVVGVLSQLRLLEFFWNEAISFPVIDRLYGSLLRDLQLGTHQIIAINADAPLADALLLMHNEGLTSVAVVDNGLNVVGNISTADVRHLTSAASLPLLKSSCMHFISVILSERGMEHGRDSFPVFYVNPYSTLAHTVAKLVATKSHRMWVVESASPSPSAPATPLLQASNPASPPGATVVLPPPPQSPLPSQGFGPVSVPSGALPGARLSGRLTGVVSLTDILNLFGKSGGLRVSDPSEARARRRRSSSASVRPSLDFPRGSVEIRR